MEIKKVSSFENPMENLSISGKNDGLQKSNLGPSFKDALAKATSPVLQETPKTEELKFSSHAVDRMMNRGISFNKADLTRLNEAVSRAASKGSKDTLVLMNDSALIVSIKNKTVVTVMDKTSLKENVFTNIDSTVVI